MPTLESRLSAWREASHQSGDLDEDELDELESHLQEHVEALERAGIEPLLAFEAARARLGNTDQLASEYQKVRASGSTQNRLAWMLGGYLLIESLRTTARLAATAASGTGIPEQFGGSLGWVALVALHAAVLLGAVSLFGHATLSASTTIPVRRLLARGRQLAGSATRRRSWALGAATLVVFAAALIAIDYGQWWAVARDQASAPRLRMTNHWFDLVEAAFLPTGAVLALLRFGRQRLPAQAHR